MSLTHFMGIDIGSHESKGVLIDNTFEIISTHSIKHVMDNPKPNFFEHDAEKVWWHDFCAISNALIQKSGIENTQVVCVGASALGGDCLPVDKDCRPLRNAILYGIDSRADKEIEFLTQHYGSDEINKFLGRPFCSSDIAPKILWIKNNEPEIYEKTHKFLTGSSYLTAKLTGNYVVDNFLALSSFNPIYNRDGSINSERCTLFCRPDQMADTRETTDVVGHVTKQAALETGLAKGTKVITGTDDSGAEAISAGVIKPGDMMLIMGSTLFLIAISDKIIHDDRIWSDAFIIPGTSSALGGTNTAGTLTSWFRDKVYFDMLEVQNKVGTNAYELMLTGLDNIPAGSDGLITLPYFAGERTPINDAQAKGLIFGLQLHHTRDHLYKSALESVGYSIAHHIEIFQENGLNPNNFIAVGGGTKNRQWLQIVSDIIGHPMKTPKVTIGASFGDALMAALGAGYLDRFEDLANVAKPGLTIHPNMDNQQIYRRYFGIFKDLYRQTQDLMHKI